MEFNYPRLKEYTYLETLGEGGQGKVVKVQDSSGRRTYGLKLLSSLQGGRVEKEIRTMQKLNHKNIVQIYDADFTDKGAYILMQHMKYGNMQEYTKNYTLGIKEKLFLIQDIADALEYVHNEKFIHRDIKPHNIFITDDGQGAYACLGDFGVVKELEAATMTKTGAGLGTIVYSSPEVLDGEQHTFQSDVYSLGMSMYEILVGKHAYNTSNLYVFFQELREKEVIAPSVYDSSVIEALDIICVRSIAKKKEERFGSVEEFSVELRKCLKLYLNEKEKEKDEGKIVIDDVGKRTDVSVLDRDEERLMFLLERRKGKIDNEVNGKGSELSQEFYKKDLDKPDLFCRDDLGHEQNSTKGGEDVGFEKVKEQYEDSMLSANELYKKGNRYYNGYEGVRGDPVKARIYYEKAAKRGNAEAINKLSEYNALFNEGVDRKDNEYCNNVYEGKKQENQEKINYEKIVKENFLERYGLNNKDDESTDKCSRVMSFWEERAKKGNIEALYKLGNLYRSGNSTLKENYAKALEYYEQAARSGHPKALVELGDLYRYGCGVEQDYVKAAECYEQAALEDDEEAVGNLINLHEAGYGSKDDVKAERYYLLSKEYRPSELSKQYKKLANLYSSRGLLRQFFFNLRRYL